MTTMQALAAADPWANTDHDPTSYAQPTIIAHAPMISVSHALAMAREDIHHANTIAGDDHGCRQYALSARDNAAQVLCDPNSNTDEMRDAGYYFAEAEAIIAASGADPDAA
jgi:hypothetical protein